ncbi:cytochrome c [Rhodovulum sp. ES.010]|uniref:cytochrome c n=1 Tax=Rhodovulum sp. ES.010 TaxID=1882821 RepID=UPI0020CA0D6E|nr:cytochrome c [Rhodovulum sp. ES.010]
MELGREIIRTHLTLAGLCLCLAPAVAPAQSSDMAARAAAIEAGKQEYMLACAGCHEDSGKWDGPIAAMLEIETPDLTRISERMGGTFPVGNTLLLIDGRETLRAHGGEMPVWGDRFLAAAQDRAGPDATAVDAELAGLGRTLALVYYLESIQR